MSDNRFYEPQYYGGTIPDSTVDLDVFLHDYFETLPNYQVFIRLLQLMFNDIKSIADHMETLSDVNNVIPSFLPRLSQIMNYVYRTDLSDDVNRDIIKRLLWIYKSKGTDKYVLEATDFANNDNWIASTFFVPTATKPIPEPDPRTASIYYPVNYLFRHNISNFSESHRYQDSERWRDGVIVIQAENININVREAIKRVLPAGLGYYFDSMSTFISDDEPYGYDKVLCFTDWNTLLGYELNYLLDLDDMRGTDRWSGDNANYPHIFSGSQMLFPHYEVFTTKAASMLPLYGTYDTEYCMNIFYFLDLMEAYLPTKIVYDKDLEKSVIIANKSEQNDSDLEVSGKQSWNIFGVTPYSGGLNYSMVIDTDTTMGTTIGTNESTTNISNSGGTSQGLSDEQTAYLLHAAQILHNPNETRLKYFFKMTLLEYYSKIFSPWTANPIHDIDYQVSEVDINKRWNGLAIYSKKGTLSGKYPRSGHQNTLWIQARYDHVIPSERWYKVTDDVKFKIPALSGFADLTEDPIKLPDENLLIDPNVYKYMEYRGPVGVKYYDDNIIVLNSKIDEIELTTVDGNAAKLADLYVNDIISGNKPVANLVFTENDYQTFLDLMIDDLVIVETSELKTLFDVKFNDILQVSEQEKLLVSDVTYNVPYGKIQYVVYHGGLDRYVDDYERAPIDVSYQLEYPNRTLFTAYINERLIINDVSHAESTKICDLKFDTLHFGKPIQEMMLDETISTYNNVYEIPLSDVTADMVIFPYSTHSTTRVFDESFDLINNKLPLHKRNIFDMVKVLET